MGIRLFIQNRRVAYTFGLIPIDPLSARRRLLSRRRGRPLYLVLARGAGLGAVIVVCAWLLLAGLSIFVFPGV